MAKIECPILALIGAFLLNQIEAPPQPNKRVGLKCRDIPNPFPFAKWVSSESFGSWQHRWLSWWGVPNWAAHSGRRRGFWQGVIQSEIYRILYAFFCLSESFVVSSIMLLSFQHRHSPQVHGDGKSGSGPGDEAKTVRCPVFSNRRLLLLQFERGKIKRVKGISGHFDTLACILLQDQS